MKNKILGSAVIAALATIGTSANADLVNDGSMMLSITEGVPTCLLGGTYPACDYGAFSVAAGGSYFKMDGNNAAVLGAGGVWNQGSGAGVGLIVGGTQPFNGTAPSSGNPYDGSGNNIVDAWPFFNNTGTNFTVSATTGTTTGTTSTMDMTGWRVAWAEVPSINMGGDGVAIADGGNGTGIAAITCTDGAGNASHCDIGDSYSLTYSAVVPAGDPSNFGGTPYDLVLNGTIVNAVPVPAAVWLFGSGLLGLVGVARRKKTA